MFHALFHCWEAVRWDTVPYILRLGHVMFRANFKQNSTSSENSRISSLVASHVSWTFSVQLGWISNSNSRFLSVGESRVSRPYSAQTGGKPNAPTRISSSRASHFPRTWSPGIAWFAPNDEIRVLTIELQSFCTEYVVTKHDPLQPKIFCIGARPTQVGAKYVLYTWLVPN